MFLLLLLWLRLSLLGGRGADGLPEHLQVGWHLRECTAAIWGGDGSYVQKDAVLSEDIGTHRRKRLHDLRRHRRNNRIWRFALVVRWVGGLLRCARGDLHGGWWTCGLVGTCRDLRTATAAASSATCTSRWCFRCCGWRIEWSREGRLGCRAGGTSDDVGGEKRTDNGGYTKHSCSSYSLPSRLLSSRGRSAQLLLLLLRLC
mmetsp:Transcript_41277/g.81432  ORF Transcript_41277/g.81432 Transcript_41277/m.81432 type:complete len:202 (+) Transcript_41277:1648-2253(+)